MSLVVEDGTGRADAEAFATVAQFKAYCDARGISYAGLTPDSAIEQALRKGADYMEGVYRERWGGQRAWLAQALSWPRDLVEIKDGPRLAGAAVIYYPNDTVPTPVVNANIELAVRAAAGDLNADLSQGVKSKAVGTLRIDYDTNTPQSKRYPAVDAMLRPLLKGSGGISLVRG